jgi:uncharacterized repeat protein (TIGR01451 family)
MRFLYSIAVILFFVELSFSQMSISNGVLTPEQYVQNIVGPGVTVSNVTFTGNASQIATYGGTSNIGFPSGVVLSSGSTDELVGPASNSTGGTTNISGITSSMNTTVADLLTIANANLQSLGIGSSSLATDGVILEFDFVPIANNVTFNFVFSSDEYLTYVNTVFNDIFGFFVSGPGIAGPYSSPPGFPNGSVNLAKVPGTNLPITVSTIHPGLNAQYYIDNSGGTTHVMNGFTVPIPISFNVVCGELYHFKFAVADCSDNYLSTAVFLQESSFNSYPGSASVLVFNDMNQDCVATDEIGISGVNVTVQPGNYIATTDTFGVAAFTYLPNGNYTATIDTTNLNWSPTCGITQSFQVVNGEADCIGIGMLNDNPCTDPDVSIYAPFLRPCLPNQMIFVQACNQATATGILNASYVDVELDPLMTITSSSLPYSIQGSNVYRFQTGNIMPGNCVDFTIATTISSPTVDCAGLLGQTLCMDAHLYPAQACALDTVPSNPPTTGGGTLNGFPQPCTLPWDQSSLSVDGWCANDSIYFTITNTGQPGGGDMECYSPMWITVDGVVTYTDSIMIPGGQTITLSFPGDGQTWQLNASQHPLHPGNSNPNAYVELCGDSTNFTPGLVNELPLNDADPVVDIYCGTVTGSYDPNDKTGYPTGQTDQKYIQPNQQLQYMIRFQNTGTDTAFTVVIRDTLDTDLNIFTVTPGVASHPYTFKMYGPRVLEWTFDNINLPDSTTDQAGSNGFATFHVEQVPNLSPGTVINNDADIYFDFNAPITTNTTVHRIYEGFVSVAALEEMIASKPSIRVYPNPSNGSFTIRLEKASAEQTFRIFDQQGRTVKTGNLDGKQTTLELHGLSGMYYLMVGQEVVKVQVVR